MTISGKAEGRRYTVETLPANVLEIDPAVQRSLNPSRVSRMANMFDESALGVFTISLRQKKQFGGTDEVRRYVVLDGQTRLAALRQFTGHEDTAMPVVAQVYHGLTRAEEAEIFLRHNDRAAVRTIDKFRIALVAGESWALAVRDTAVKHGFEPDIAAPAERRFVAISTAQRLRALTEGQEALDRAFELVVRAWGHRTNAASADSIGGLGLLFHRHGDAVDVVSFARRLARTDTPQTFISGVAQYKAALGLSRYEGSYRYALKVYNAGLRSNKLEPKK